MASGKKVVGWSHWLKKKTDNRQLQLGRQRAKKMKQDVLLIVGDGKSYWRQQWHQVKRSLVGHIG